MCDACKDFASTWQFNEERAYRILRRELTEEELSEMYGE